VLRNTRLNKLNNGLTIDPVPPGRPNESTESQILIFTLPYEFVFAHVRAKRLMRPQNGVCGFDIAGVELTTRGRYLFGSQTFFTSDLLVARVVARGELGRLRKLNSGRYDFDAEDRKKKSAALTFSIFDNRCLQKQRAGEIISTRSRKAPKSGTADLLCLSESMIDEKDGVIFPDGGRVKTGVQQFAPITPTVKAIPADIRREKRGVANISKLIFTRNGKTISKGNAPRSLFYCCEAS
jgi:hypothetical protein